MKSEEIKQFLNKNVWSDSTTDYYEIQKVDIGLLEHPGYRKLCDLCRNLHSTLDVGCGDGSKTQIIYNCTGVSNAWGVDLSTVAINKAKKNFGKLRFKIADIERLPFRNDEFDVVYTGFVMEHTQVPDKVISEMMRVTKPGGRIVIICPNYGAPSRCSPPFAGNRLTKIVRGFLNDFIFWRRDLNWNFVIPISRVGSKHVMDYDTTVEPYVLNLKRYFYKNNFKVEIASSLWELDEGNSKFHKIIKLIGSFGLFPFMYWGPQVLLVAKKN